MASWIAKTFSAAPRRRQGRRLVLAGALLLAGTAGAQTIDEERRALSAAKVQAAQADARAASLEQKAAAERGQAERVQAEAAAVAARIQSAEADIGAGEARVRLIEQLQAEQTARLALRQEPAVRLLAGLQTMARRPPLLALVQPGSTRDLVRVRAMLSAMTPVLQARTAGLRSDIARSQQLRADAARAVTALAGSRARLRAEQARLAQIEASHRTTSARFASSALTEQDRAIALGEQARDIVDLMDRMSVSAETGAQLATLPGPVLRPASPGVARAMPDDAALAAARTLPYRLPVSGTVVSGLGEVSDAGVRARGLTIATRPGAQVVAPAGGRIVFAGPYRGFGQILIIDHGGGWTTLVTSLAALHIRVGDSVMQGSPIGRAGNDRPTITVELRRGNRPIDITNIVG